MLTGCKLLLAIGYLLFAFFQLRLGVGYLLVGIGKLLLCGVVFVEKLRDGFIIAERFEQFVQSCLGDIADGRAVQLIVRGLYLVVYRRDLIKLRLTLVTLLFCCGKLLFAVGYLLFTVGYLLFAVGNFLFLFGNELLGGGVIRLALIQLRLGSIIFLLPLVQLSLALVVLLLTGAYFTAAVFVGHDGGGIALGGIVAALFLDLGIAVGYERYRVTDIVVAQIGLAQNIGDIIHARAGCDKAEHGCQYKADADDRQCNSFH